MSVYRVWHSVETFDLYACVCGKPPRAPYRRPMSDEECERMAEVLRDLGINVD